MREPDALRNEMRLADEAVPLLRWLLPERARPALMALHGFARGVHELAEDPMLKDAARRGQLQQLRQKLEIATQMGGDVRTVPDWARPFARLVQHGRASLTLAVELLAAREEDMRHSPVRDYEALLVHAQGAAVPVGRLALQMIHGEDAPKAALHPLDALCVAWRLLQVVRDAGRDHLVLHRTFLPGDWMRQGGAGGADLERARSTPALRGVMDRVLERAGALLDAARMLPATLPERRFRLLARVLLLQARALHRLLKTHDPLQSRLRLSRRAQWECVWRAVMEEWLERKGSRRD